MSEQLDLLANFWMATFNIGSSFMFILWSIIWWDVVVDNHGSSYTKAELESYMIPHFIYASIGWSFYYVYWGFGG